jgi:hypothetical protein
MPYETNVSESCFYDIDEAISGYSEWTGFDPAPLLNKILNTIKSLETFPTAHERLDKDLESSIRVINVMTTNYQIYFTIRDNKAEVIAFALKHARLKDSSIFPRILNDRMKNIENGNELLFGLQDIENTFNL